MDINENERCAKRIVKSIDGVDQVLLRLAHEAEELALCDRKAFCKRRISETLGYPRKKL